MKDIEDYIRCARQHGQDDEPDHEVGDLQDLLREAWALMNEEQRVALMNGDAASALEELLADEEGIGE